MNKASKTAKPVKKKKPIAKTGKPVVKTAKKVVKAAKKPAKATRASVRPLTQQMEDFALAFVSGKSQADAYRHAYPKSVNWKPNALYVNASRLLAQPNIVRRVNELRARVASKTVLKRAEVLNTIRIMTSSTVKSLINDNGKFKKPHELDDETCEAIASIEIDRYGAIKYKFWDKNSAVEKAARVLGLYEKDNKQRADALGELLNGLSGNVKGVVPQEPHQEQTDDDA